MALNQHFYHSLTNKYIAAFGALFNDITLVKYNNAKTSEIKRTKVPIQFGPREKYLVMNQEKDRAVQQTLPLMTFNLLDMTYNAPRKLNSLHRIPKANNVSGNADSIYNGVPYDLTFELGILARNKDDAFQILEQIIPSFTPTLQISMIAIPEIGIVSDIPITLNSISSDIAYDTDFDEIMSVEYTLQFTMAVQYWGPISYTKIIKRAFANTFIDESLYAGAIIRLNMSAGNNGVFKMEDIVYQGNTINEARAAGIVVSWDAPRGRLVIGGVQGNFTTNVAIKAGTTNAVYTLESFDVSPMKVQSIKIEPDPIDAEPPEPYGFAEELKEFPDTLD